MTFISIEHLWNKLDPVVTYVIAAINSHSIISFSAFLFFHIMFIYSIKYVRYLSLSFHDYTHCVHLSILL